MNESQQAEAEDLLWLCNSTDHESFETHDYCHVHWVTFPTDEPCPETLARLERVRTAAVAEAWADGWDVRPLIRERLARAWDEGYAASRLPNPYAIGVES